MHTSYMYTIIIDIHFLFVQTVTENSHNSLGILYYLDTFTGVRVFKFFLSYLYV